MKNKSGALALIIGLALSVSACAPTVSVEKAQAGSASAQPEQRSSAPVGGESSAPAPEPTSAPADPGTSRDFFVKTDADLAAILAQVKVVGQDFKPMPAADLHTALASGGESNVTARYEPAACQALVSEGLSVGNSAEARSAMGRANVAGSVSASMAGALVLQMVAVQKDDAGFLTRKDPAKQAEAMEKCKDMTMSVPGSDVKYQAQMAMLTPPKVGDGATISIKAEYQGQKVDMIMSATVVKNVMVMAVSMQQGAGGNANDIVDAVDQAASKL